MMYANFWINAENYGVPNVSLQKLKLTHFADKFPSFLDQSCIEKLFSSTTNRILMHKDDRSVD